MDYSYEERQLEIKILNLKHSLAGRNIIDIPVYGFEAECAHVLLGPSGSGKTTLLRIIGGLIKATSGSVIISNHTLHGINKNAGMMFQDIDSFPWLTVEQNLKKVYSGKYDDLEVREIIERVGLTKVRQFYPNQLSGGMRKRLAFGRLISAGKKILLMDEPFSSLDMSGRFEMWNLFRRIKNERKLTSFIVTHDVEEAVTLGEVIHLFEGPPLRPAARWLGMGRTDVATLRSKITARHNFRDSIGS